MDIDPPEFEPIPPPFDHATALTTFEVLSLVEIKKKNMERTLSKALIKGHVSSVGLDNVTSYINDVHVARTRDEAEVKRQIQNLRGSALPLAGSDEDSSAMVYFREFEIAALVNLQPRNATEALNYVPWLGRYKDLPLARAINSAFGGAASVPMFMQGPNSPWAVPQSRSPAQVMMATDDEGRSDDD